MPSLSRQFDGTGQTGQPYQHSSEVDLPLSHSSATNSSTGQATAWRSKSLSRGGPMSMSSKTRGTTYNWDDAPTTPIMKSDKGSGRNE